MSNMRPGQQPPGWDSSIVVSGIDLNGSTVNGHMGNGRNVNGQNINGQTKSKCASKMGLSEKRQRPEKSHRGDREEELSDEPKLVHHGKFDDLSDFMEIDPDEFVIDKLSAIKDEMVGPGCIFYVSDPDSNLDTRVLLCLRSCRSGCRCLNFCLHESFIQSQGHWRVCEANDIDSQNDYLNFKPLEVILQPYGLRGPTVAPQMDITIDIDEVWNVKDEVVVKIIGHATLDSFQALIDAVNNQFCHSMLSSNPQPHRPMLAVTAEGGSRSNLRPSNSLFPGSSSSTSKNKVKYKRTS